MTHNAVAEDRRPRPIAVGIVVAGAVAALPATWWVLGRLDKSGAWITDPDYAVNPPQIDRTLAHAIGAGSLVAFLIGTAVLVGTIRSGRWRRCVAGVFAPAVAGFAYVGMAAHVMTAPVIGANIGAGLIVMAGLPVCVLLLGVGTAAGRACRRLSDPPPPPHAAVLD
ncbi:MAG: hypothetical protein HKN91_05775 [Acidimicrobiia bacterium]|nr:hypothetical protein [Acidimicrobiia bacterium]